ncbi:hypothetical protein LUX57_05305 [Actinomadura madurae]|uniref:hypothetical protein n=1 Tax=Actinomadura madurae TaxID=1993 RepID=UPI0020D2065F|nr:hypothetical protein [Actinomadura madurae]MCP9964643.1 hypothetical protein [Actinomadura madurae]
MTYSRSPSRVPRHVCGIISGGGGTDAVPSSPHRAGTFTVAAPHAQAGSGAVNDWITSNRWPASHRSS